MAGLDPVTARAGLRTAREVISGRQISYPIPYLLVVLCAFSIACLIVALFAVDSVRVVALVLCCLALITAIAVLVVAIFLRPELLRSERHEQVMRLINLVGDREMEQADWVEFTTALLGEAKARGRRDTKMGEHHD